MLHQYRNTSFDLCHECWYCGKVCTVFDKFLTNTTFYTEECPALSGFSKEYYESLNNIALDKAFLIWKSNNLGLTFLEFLKELGI